MKCRDPRVSQILVGLNRIGFIGLTDAIRRAAETDLADRDAVVDFVIDALDENNYVPDRSDPLLRTALWREFLRERGEAFHEFFSEADVTVRGRPGRERDAFVETLEAVLAEFELKPRVRFAEPEKEGAKPQLVIRDEVVVEELLGKERFRQAVRKSFSDW